MYWHRLCLWELLKFVSKSELPFYEEVAGLREEKSALVGQGHWKALTGNKSCKLSSPHLTALHKKSAWKLFSCPSLQYLSGHPWNEHPREVYFIIFRYTIGQGIYSSEMSRSPGVCQLAEIFGMSSSGTTEGTDAFGRARPHLGMWQQRAHSALVQRGRGAVAKRQAKG